MTKCIAYLIVLLPTVAMAGSQRAQVQVAATSASLVPAGFVAVPFAVPVAMPSYVQYQAVGGLTTTAGSFSFVPSGGDRAGVCASCAEKSSARSAGASVDAPPASLVIAQCGRCHGATQPKGGLDLTGTLDGATRLKAITRLLADDPRQRMPKGTVLAPEVLGELIQELARPGHDRPTPALEAK